MRRALVVVALAALLLGGLSACGKKGDLRAPPTNRVEAPVAPAAPIARVGALSA
ncbi:MAG: hypothetical protein IIA00_05970 [Proteobacteria bacterium]|nr:hypothetical protein [Pseudomonadota bacterium]